MTKFRKKPVVIEAFQMTHERRWDNSEWPNWLHQAWQLGHNEPGAFFCRPERGADKDPVYIHTLEGTHLVSWGDWIIQGVQGKLYPCKPDIFEATYEEAEQPECPHCAHEVHEGESCRFPTAVDPKTGGA